MTVSRAQKSSDLILPFHTMESLQMRIGWFINLRWIAVFGILSAVVIGQNILSLDLAFSEIIIIAFLLLVLNIIYFFLNRYLHFVNFVQDITFAEIQVLIDLIIISFLVHYSGCIYNPFFFLYALHVIISGIFFPGNLPYLNAVFVLILQTGWTLLQYIGYVKCYRFGYVGVDLPVLITSLGAFYIVIVAATYIIVDFMKRYRNLKTIIDEKNRLLEKSMEERNRVFRFTAHELKSPLTVIRSTLSVVEELYSKELKTEVREMVIRAGRRSDQVLDMVKEMIEITRYHRGLEEQKYEYVDLEEWLSQLIDRQRSYAVAKGIELKLSKLDIKSSVVIEISSMQKIVCNLLNNALRYTPSGGTVTIEPFVKMEKYGFSVEDTGIGIPEDDIAKIFDEFYRGNNAKKMENIGTGLGLSLVKEIVDKLGGEIRVESRIGKGTIFSVEMPSH